MPTLANKRNEYLDKTYDEDLEPLDDAKSKDVKKPTMKGDTLVMPPVEVKRGKMVNPKEVLLSTDSWTGNPMDASQYVAGAAPTVAKAIHELPAVLRSTGLKATVVSGLKAGLRGALKGGVGAIAGDIVATNFIMPAIASATTGNEWTPQDVDAAVDIASVEVWRAIQDAAEVGFAGAARIGGDSDKKVGRGHFKALWKQALAGGAMQAYMDSIDLTISQKAMLMQKAAEAAKGESIRKYMEDNPPARLEAARERRLTGKKED